MATGVVVRDSSTICLEPGHWVLRNQSRKRWRLTEDEAVTCPAVLSRWSWIASASERRVECCTGARQTAIATNRFAPCDGRHAPTLSEVLRALRGRTVSMVGDSTMQQLWTGLVAELFAGQHRLEFVHRVLEFDIKPENHNRDRMCTVSHTNPPKVGGSELHFRLDARTRRPCNLTEYHGGPAASLWPLRSMCHSIPDTEIELPEWDVRFFFYRVDKNASKNIKKTYEQRFAHCNTPYKNFEAKVREGERESRREAHEWSVGAMRGCRAWWCTRGSSTLLTAHNSATQSAHSYAVLHHNCGSLRLQWQALTPSWPTLVCGISRRTRPSTAERSSTVSQPQGALQLKRGEDQHPRDESGGVERVVSKGWQRGRASITTLAITTLAMTARHDSPDDRPRSALPCVSAVLSRLGTLASQRKLGLYRQSTPQHFPTDSGSGYTVTHVPPSSHPVRPGR